jgi:hypothetical protein
MERKGKLNSLTNSAFAAWLGCIAEKKGALLAKWTAW